MFQGGTAVLEASALGDGLNYAFGIFLARQLGINDFGLHALRLTIFNTLGLLVLFGMDTGAVKFVSEQLERGDHAKGIRTVGLVASIAVISIRLSLILFAN